MVGSARIAKGEKLPGRPRGASVNNDGPGLLQYPAIRYVGIGP